MSKTLRVTGQATTSGKPDTFVISFSLEILNDNYSIAIKKLNEKVNILRKVLIDNELDPLILKTFSFSIYRETKWDSALSNDIFIGYKASHRTRIELPIDKKLMNNLLNDLTLKAKDIDFRVSFILKDTKSFIENLLQKAIANAKSTAKVISDASEVKLKEIISIDYSFNQIHFIESSSTIELASSRMLQSSIEIEPEDVKADKSVTITWLIES
ncbi:MAG: SIMPL domain-containing protein [Candidatus Tenebribacter davisii]|nr:SIMPL domain-containing protein [Candidatus Tenebribacter davisii]